jgi:hypothetical protein
MGDPNYPHFPQGPGQPIGPGHPDFGKPVDPRFANQPPLDPQVRARVGGPLSVWGTVGEAFRLYGADFGKLWAVTAAIAVPWAVLIFILRVVTLPSATTLQDGKIYLTSLNANANTYQLVSTLGSVLQSLILLIAIGASYRIVLGRRLGHTASMGVAFGFAFQRAPKLLGVVICTAIAVLIGFICIILPGIYLAVAFTLAIPVLMAEDLGVFASMGRSMELLKHFWWHAFACIVVTGVVIGIAAGVLEFGVVSAIVHSSHSPTELLVVSGVLNALFLIIVSPLSAALATVLYTDMLLRKSDPHLARLLA